MKAGEAREVVFSRSKGSTKQPPQPPELPTEILSRIFDYVESKSVLQTIALCCHQFYDLVGPVLYGSIRVRPGSGVDKHESLIENDHLRRITHHLLHKRNFAPFVRHLKLCGPTGDDYDYQASLGSVEDTKLKTSVQKYLRRPENADTKLAQTGVSWLTFNLDDRITVPVLLIALLPRLKSLHLQVPDERLLADSLLSLNVFLGLEEMGLEWIPQQGRILLSSITAQHFKDLVTIKSVRKAYIVRLASLSIYPHASPFQKMKPESSEVTHLEFRESRLDAKDFGSILAAFRSLRTFIYEQSWHPSLGRRSVKPVILLLTLRNLHKESLENIWLNFSIRYNQQNAAPHYLSFAESGLNCLPDFVSLKRLCLPMELLCSYSPAGMNDSARNCLPPSIETLVLIKHIHQGVCSLSDFANDFFRHWQNMRVQEDVKFLPILRTVVFIAHMDQYLHKPNSMLNLVESVLDLEVVFAMDEHFGIGTAWEDLGSERLTEVAGAFGLTNLNSKRWRVVDKTKLKV